MSGDSDVSDSEADELKTLELEIKPDCARDSGREKATCRLHDGRERWGEGY